MAPPRSDLVQRAKTRLGTVLKDKFRLEAVLGVGGMATVYAAVHRNGKRVALKLLHPQFAADPDLVTRFLREGYVANKVEHPGCVNVLDDDCEDEAVFLVMELLDGHSLDRFTRPNGPRMPLEAILRVADETLDVLAVAHAKGITHRDLKPANLFVTRDGRTKVLDFGIARLADPGIDGSSTQTGVAIGTPAFMPPEQARGRKHEIDARTDIWALGATILALLAGDRPRRAETGEEELLLAMTAPIPPVMERVPSTPPAIAAVVDRALAFDRTLRWPDARSMQMALRDAVHASPEAPRDPSGPLVDTAPVLMAQGVVPNDPPTPFATGATMRGYKKARLAGRRALVMVFSASFVGALAVVCMVWVATTRHSPGANGGTSDPAPAVAPASPQPSSSAAAAPFDPPAPSTVQPPTPAPPTIDVAALPSATAPAPRPNASVARPQPAAARPPPAAARPAAAPAPPAASVNPLGQRF